MWSIIHPYTQVHAQPTIQSAEEDMSDISSTFTGTHSTTEPIASPNLDTLPSSGIDLEHAKAIENLSIKLDAVKVSASSNTAVVGGMSVSRDVLMVHDAIKRHRLPYTDSEAPPGSWIWNGLREIKNKAGTNTNPNLTLPDGVSVFYGSLKYGYKIDVSGTTKVIEHDVVSIHPIFLDAQARPNTRSGSGIYGVDWWNIYMPMNLLQRISADICSTTGYLVSEEGIIKDPNQSLVSITVNVRKIEESPKVTMVIVEDDGTVSYEPMGTLVDIMQGGGEANLIAGMAFVSVGLSYKGYTGQESPPAGTPLKLSIKMQAFHAIELIESGIQRITYTPASKALEY
jgi:hypothetical protein